MKYIFKIIDKLRGFALQLALVPNIHALQTISLDQMKSAEERTEDLLYCTCLGLLAIMKFKQLIDSK